MVRVGVYLIPVVCGSDLPASLPPFMWCFHCSELVGVGSWFRLS